MLPKNPLIIAVDFDGTIVEDAYPKIGNEMIFAFDTLKRLQSQGHRLILWTYRSGKKLQEAVDFCKENGIEFYAINKNFPEEEYDEKYSRKIHADLFIDDRNVGGFLGWTAIHKAIFNYEPPVKKKKGFFSFFK
ncbi:BT0820 family HAD-type phosphatase [Polaribacter sargassicola]|uniref:BT0820 family HAD-type phosphatase n=1 Tax=Polaribacter sargassicola TaxID=2836891 RepID=UPI001F27CBE2|nr:hydrolase [Polaribacter sp. DS7-9]MCG1037526.1 hydrolase [Polaribacter sp. DS7-9]